MTRPKRINVSIVRWPGDVPFFEAYREVAETVRCGLAHLGHDVSLSDHRILFDRINVIFGFHILDPAALGRLPPSTIFYNLEQLLHGELKPIFSQVRSHVTVWDSSARNCERWQWLGATRVVHVPIGYVPEMRRIAAAAPPDIDVLFYGQVDERRARVLRGLRAAGLRVCVLQRTYGGERDRHIARSKVVLNMHLYDTRIFEIVRVAYLLANAKAVVSECAPDTEIDEALRDAVQLAAYDELVDACAALVRDNTRRHALEQRGFAIMSARDERVFLARALAETSV